MTARGRVPRARTVFWLVIILLSLGNNEPTNRGEIHNLVKFYWICQKKEIFRAKNHRFSDMIQMRESIILMDSGRVQKPAEGENDHYQQEKSLLTASAILVWLVPRRF